MKNLNKIIVLIATSLIFQIANGEIVVVVSNKSNIERLTRSEVVNIFMGKYRVLPDGSSAIPVDMPNDTPERKAFYKKLVDKSLEEINAYWARLIFAGKTPPPTELKNRESIANSLTQNGAVAYIDRKNLTKDMRIVLTLPE